jgi:hypothetical protein
MRRVVHVLHVVRALPRAVPAAAFAVLGGCYHYAATPVDQLQVGMEVRAQLSGTAVQRLRAGSESLGALLEGFTVTGHLLQMASDSLVLSVPRTEFEGDYRAHVLTQNLLLARAEVLGTEVKRLDRRKTAALALGAGIATFVIVQQSRRGAGSTGGVPVLGGPPENRLPGVYRWPFP